MGSDSIHPKLFPVRVFRGFPTRMVYLKHDIAEIHHSGRKHSIYKWRSRLCTHAFHRRDPDIHVLDG